MIDAAVPDPAVPDPAVADPRVAQHLQEVSLAFDRRAWHGPNLLGSLRGTKLAESGWRPQPDRHNVAEIVVHCAYWKYRVCRLLNPERHPGFSRPGSDWLGSGGWAAESDRRRDLGLLHDWHRRMAGEIAELDPARLTEPAGPDDFTVSELLSGAAAHDIYHAGQIRLLRRMCASAGAE